MYNILRMTLFSVVLLSISCGAEKIVRRSDEINSHKQAAKDTADVKVNAENSEVLSLLDQNCASCHNATTSSGSIDFISNFDKLLERGLVFPGNSKDSRLFQVMAQGSMPPGKKLSDVELKLVSNWIDAELAKKFQDKGVAVVDQKRCPPIPEIDRQETPTYLSDMQRIVGTHCVGCHSATEPHMGRYEELKSSAGGQGLSMAESGKMPIPGHGFPAVSAADLKIFQDFRSGLTPHNSNTCPTIQDHIPVPSCELKVFGSTTVAAGSDVTVSAYIEGVASSFRWEDLSVETKIADRNFARVVKLDRSKVLKLFVKSPSGESSCSLKLETLPQAPSCQFGVANNDGSLNASPQVSYGGNIALTLLLAGSVDSAKYENQDAIDIAQSQIQRSISNLIASKNYSATVKGSGFPDYTCTASVAVGAAPPPATCQISYTQQGTGTSYQINMSGNNASKLFIRNKTANGSFQTFTTALTQTITAVTEFEGYGTNAVNQNGPNCNIIVTPNQVNQPAPTCSISASKTSLVQNEDLVLNYSVASGTATAAQFYNGTIFTPTTVPSGSMSFKPQATATYNVQLTYAGGTTVFCAQPVTVTVTLPPPPPNCSLSANPSLLLPGANYKLSMNTTGTVSSAAINSVPCSASSNCKLVAAGQYELPMVAPTAEGNYPYSASVSGAGVTKSCSTNIVVSTQQANTGLRKLAKFGNLIKSSYCAFCHLEVKGDLYVPTDHTFGGKINVDVDYRTKAWVSGKIYNMASKWRLDYENGGIIHVPSGNIINNYTGSSGLPTPKSGKIPQLPWVDPQMRNGMTGSLTGVNQSGQAVNVSKLFTGTLVVTSPIVINKDVFVDGDLIIKGTYSGVGTIYVTGHVYIPGNLTANNSSAFLGIAAQKSINLGYLYRMWMTREDKEAFKNNSDVTGCVGPLTADGYACLPANMPGGQAAFEALYDTYNPATNKCPSATGSAVRMNDFTNPKRASFTRMEAFLYTPNSINGVAEAQQYTIKGGVVTQHYHILSCARNLKADEGSVVGSSVLEYDPRMSTGTLPVLEYLGGQYND